ncbi:hypothetical protein BpHYR1_020284 [Brachionus plicatilis]|uniref:Uncharacterized protein n=1 Tax=Brachionus plicatilis TaxID=10195 RepID=A0A3M7PA40_BRAPC|nr:hypothetical protein BpHYR1_020284 [Brachionus plicatilis]
MNKETVKNQFNPKNKKKQKKIHTFELSLKNQQKLIFIFVLAYKINQNVIEIVDFHEIVVDIPDNGLLEHLFIQKDSSHNPEIVHLSFKNLNVLNFRLHLKDTLFFTLVDSWDTIQNVQ